MSHGTGKAMRLTLSGRSGYAGVSEEDEEDAVMLRKPTGSRETKTMSTQKDGKSRILIVDNDEDVLRIFDNLFRNEGFDTRTTWSGHEALALAKSRPFDVFLVDDYLPDLHSADFLKRLSRHSAQPSIIVMRKGKPTPAELRHYESLGATAVVNKNDLEQVQRAVDACGSGESASRARVN
jgi:CheY-like chemotaxis protein